MFIFFAPSKKGSLHEAIDDFGKYDTSKFVIRYSFFFKNLKSTIPAGKA